VSPIPLEAQPGPSLSVGYDFFPWSTLADPTPGTFEEGLEVKIATLYAEASPAPFVFAEGRTVLVNTLSYHRFDMDYANWNDAQGGNRIENTQSIEYTLVLVRQLSEAWNLTAVVTPGLHSDFKADLSYDDFNLQGALVFGRQHSKGLSYGLGAAYTLKYGEPLPMPILVLQWMANPRWKADLFLPMHAELWYVAGPTVELGVAARVRGGQYHGSPDRYFVANPQMRYSVGTVGPSAKMRLGKNLLLTVDGGYTLMRRFEFFDGDRKHTSLDLKNSAFVRAGIKLGG